MDPQVFFGNQNDFRFISLISTQNFRYHVSSSWSKNKVWIYMAASTDVLLMYAPLSIL